jgi:hypothetical protein
MGGTITPADQSARTWEGEAAGAAEAYAEEQAAAEAARRHEAEARAAAAVGGTQPDDGVDSPADGGNESMFGPTASGGNGAGATNPRPASGSAPAGGQTKIDSVELSEQAVAELRANGVTVTSAGDGKYYINAPYDPSQNVVFFETAPLEAPSSLPPLPGEIPPIPIEYPNNNPSGGISPDPQVDAGAPAEEPKPVDPNRVVSGMGEKVDDIINMSPTLQQHWKELQAQGWTLSLARRASAGSTARSPSSTSTPA